MQTESAQVLALLKIINAESDQAERQALLATARTMLRRLQKQTLPARRPHGDSKDELGRLLRSLDHAATETRFNAVSTLHD